MSPRFKTDAERAAYNEGVKTVLDLAARTAVALGQTARRPLHEGFAIASLQELADAGVGLLLRAQPAEKAAA